MSKKASVEKPRMAPGVQSRVVSELEAQLEELLARHEASRRQRAVETRTIAAVRAELDRAQRGDR